MNFAIGGKRNMIRRFWNHWLNRRTNNFTRIPLFTMYFNHGELEEDKKSKSCHFYCHPNLEHDEYIELVLGVLCDYIRDNYDMDVFTRI